MISIIFVPHKTTEDNEHKIASGWNDVPLSHTGNLQAQNTKEYFKDRDFDIVACSDLERAYKTAMIVFGGHKKPLIIDVRLRECNYGDMNGCSKKIVEDMRSECVATGYPMGESYSDCVKRVQNFLDFLKIKFDGGSVVIVGHRATQYGLEVLCHGKKIEEVVIEPWTWQEEWVYKY